MSALSRQASAPMGAPTFTIVNHSAPDTGGRHADILINFVEAIVRGAPLIAPACEGVRSLELANAMILSAWDNCTVELPLDVERYACELSKRMGAPPPITCSFGAAMAGGRIPA
jgi:hypothetical protein